MPIPIQNKYKPLYRSNNKFIILLTGGRGSGKSFNVSLFIERLSFERGQTILFSRYTLVAADTSIIPEFRQKIELDKTENYFDITQNEIINRYSDSKILFKGIKTSSGNQTANLKSIQGLSTFVGDEMEEWQSEEDYDKLILSIRQKDVQNRVILTLNPTDDSHFLYRKYIENTHRIEEIDGVQVQISTHPDVLHIHTTYMDNERFLSDQFLNIIQQIKEQSIKEATINGEFDSNKFQKTKYATQVIGRWADIPEGAIFNNWREGEFNDNLPYCYGQDFGFSLDPDVLVKVAVDEKNKTLYVDEKYYDRKQLCTDELYLMNKSRIENTNDLIIADCAEDRLISDLNRKGLNIRPCTKGQGSVVAGITQMLSYTIVVTPHSHNIKKELRQYKWSDKKAGIPVDAHNHACDAIRYAFTKLHKASIPFKDFSGYGFA